MNKCCTWTCPHKQAHRTKVIIIQPPKETKEPQNNVRQNRVWGGDFYERLECEAALQYTDLLSVCIFSRTSQVSSFTKLPKKKNSMSSYFHALMQIFRQVSWSCRLCVHTYVSTAPKRARNNLPGFLYIIVCFETLKEEIPISICWESGPKSALNFLSQKDFLFD